MEEEDHTHRGVWQVAAPGGGHWKFCMCGRLYLRSAWHTLDEAYRISNGDWRDWVAKFLKRHQTVINNTRQEVVDILLAWAQDTRSVSGTVRDNFTLWLQEYWNLPAAPILKNAAPGTVLEYNADGSARWVVASPLTKETAVQFVIVTQRTMSGYIGQIVDGNAQGAILWESEPFQDKVDDDHNIVEEGMDLALAAAQDKLTLVKRELFA